MHRSRKENMYERKGGIRDGGASKGLGGGKSGGIDIGEEIACRVARTNHSGNRRMS